MKPLLNLLLLAVGSLMSCHNDIISDELVPEGDTIEIRKDEGAGFRGHPYHSRYITTGDTILRYRQLSVTKPAQVDLKNLANPLRKGEPFRMVVFGGSLAAGVRDGGLFNEGMETSFGSLIARQMGVEFKNPLFDKEDYNGFGRLEPTTFNPTRGPIPKFKNVSNNTGIDFTRREANGNVVLKKVQGSYDNYGFPYGSFVSQGETPMYIKGTNEYMSPFVKRLNNPDITAEIREGRTFDFFILEIPEMDQAMLTLGMGSTVKDLQQDVLNGFPEFDNGDPPAFPLGAQNDGLFYRNFFKKMRRIEAKGVILNLPHVYDLPFYQQNYKDQIRTLLNTYHVQGLNWIGAPSEIKVKAEPIGGGVLNAEVLYGYSGLDSLLSPVVNIYLKPGINPYSPVMLGFHNFIDMKNMKSVRQENTRSFKVVEEALGYPIVDLFNLYESISAGSYVTHDGIKVNGSWPGGNFFSNDGVNPSAFGQAVIANEIIKVINKHYHVTIEPVPTRVFLQKSAKY